MDPEIAAYERRRISTLPLPWWVDLIVLIERSAIRLGRLAFALVAGGGAFFLLSTAYDRLSKPIASISVIELLGAFAVGLIGIAIGVWSLGIAFGSAGRSRFESCWRESQADKRRLLGDDDSD